VEIHVAAHPVFARDGADLVCHVTIPMTAAALGTTVELPTLEADLVGDGKPDADSEAGADAGSGAGSAGAASGLETSLPLDIKAGTQSGSQIVLGGRGVPSLRGTGRGDLVVRVVVETPTRLDEQQEALLRELAALRHEESPDGQLQSAPKSVFNRLRDAFGPH
jgi:molecular chaperone DnaJ